MCCREHSRLDKELLLSLLKAFSKTSMDIEGDAFGRIYEYFLGKFAMSEGAKGGAFFTPLSIVKLIVEIIEPFHGHTTRLTVPWGVESDQTGSEVEPELHAGVHAEMIGQTALRKMSADLHLWSQPEAEDQPDCCICPVLVFWSISFREDYKERCCEESQSHDHLRQWPKLQTLGRAERCILDYEEDGFTNCNQNEQSPT